MTTDDAPDMLDLQYVEDAATAYVECAEWADWPTEDDGAEIDATLTVANADRLAEDCRAFVRDNWADLQHMPAAQAGHDFWLTRNGHGTGFWDRGLGGLGDRLTAAAKVYGEEYLDEYLS